MSKSTAISQSPPLRAVVHLVDATEEPTDAELSVITAAARDDVLVGKRKAGDDFAKRIAAEVLAAKERLRVFRRR